MIIVDSGAKSLAVILAVLTQPRIADHPDQSAEIQHTAAQPPVSPFTSWHVASGALFEVSPSER